MPPPGSARFLSCLETTGDGAWGPVRGPNDNAAAGSRPAFRPLTPVIGPLRAVRLHTGRRVVMTGRCSCAAGGLVYGSPVCAVRQPLGPAAPAPILLVRTIGAAARERCSRAPAIARAMLMSPALENMLIKTLAARGPVLSPGQKMPAIQQSVSLQTVRSLQGRPGTTHGDAVQRLAPP